MHCDSGGNPAQGRLSSFHSEQPEWILFTSSSTCFSSSPPCKLHIEARKILYKLTNLSCHFSAQSSLEVLTVLTWSSHSSAQHAGLCVRCCADSTVLLLTVFFIFCGSRRGEERVILFQPRGLAMSCTSVKPCLNVTLSRKTFLTPSSKWPKSSSMCTYRTSVLLI